MVTARRWLPWAVLLVGSVAIGCGNANAAFEQLAESRRQAADLFIQVVKTADAGNLAVMADTDEASVKFAREAEQAAAAAEKDSAALKQILSDLRYADEAHLLEQFEGQFASYRTLDRSILGLAVENTNLKAQRLSFGEAQESADVFGAAVDAAAAASRSADGELQATRARAAVLAMQVLQARHIAEANDAAMDQMEQQMAAREGRARAAVERLRASSGSGAARDLGSAGAALDRFVSVNQQIVQLSRRNTNVRSLALTLGRKRVVAAEAEDQLRSLGDELAAHTFQATR